MWSTLAHTGRPPEPHDLWGSWGLDPVVVYGLVLLGWLYARGFRRWRIVAGGERVASRRRAAAFSAGLVVCWIALESPVAALGAALFSGHMAQHQLLTVVAAPLLVLGRPTLVAARGLPPRWGRAVGRAMHRVTAVLRPSGDAAMTIAVFAVFTASFWAWHLPALYDAAARTPWIHGLEHATFLAGAMVFWATVFGRRARRNGVIGAALLAPAFLMGAWGGGVLTFSRVVLYDAYRTTTEPWGLSPIADQNLGGAVMLAAGPVYLGVAGWLFVRATRASERTGGLAPATGGLSAG